VKTTSSRHWAKTETDKKGKRPHMESWSSDTAENKNKNKSKREQIQEEEEEAEWEQHSASSDGDGVGYDDKQE
jgi:hypothetical protein